MSAVLFLTERGFKEQSNRDCARFLFRAATSIEQLILIRLPVLRDDFFMWRLPVVNDLDCILKPALYIGPGLILNTRSPTNNG